MCKNPLLDVEVRFPQVNLSLLSGILLKKFHAVVDPGADSGGGCDACAFNQSSICRHVSCDNVIYVPFLDPPCL